MSDDLETGEAIRRVARERANLSEEGLGQSLDDGKVTQIRGTRCGFVLCIDGEAAKLRGRSCGRPQAPRLLPKPTSPT